MCISVNPLKGLLLQLWKAFTIKKVLSPASAFTLLQHTLSSWHFVPDFKRLPIEVFLCRDRERDRDSRTDRKRDRHDREAGEVDDRYYSSAMYFQPDNVQK